MSEQLPPPVQLIEHLTGPVRSYALLAIAKLGVADYLSDGPLNVRELAARTDTNEDSLYRVLRALATIGIFEENPARCFGLTPMAALLQSDSPGRARAFALMATEHAPALAEIMHSLNTGRPSFDQVYGEPIFDYLSKHPESAQTFDEAMTGIHGPETPAMIDAYDFSGFKVIVDVGGGNGSTLLAVLHACPDTKGILFDLPHVVERTAGIIAAERCAERCTIEAGSFFESVPGGADAYILRHIIHDWDDERSMDILKCLRAAMPSHGRVLVVESVIPPGNVPHPGKWLDVIMLTIAGGRERTQEEYEALFERAGLSLVRIVPTRSPVSVIEAMAA